MKTIILSLLLALISVVAFAQNDKKESTFTVSGNCNMCKARIEKAAKVDGVSSAVWNSKTQKITVKYQEDKITLNQIHQLIAAVGHDTDKIKATDKVYNKLHGCCQYRD